MSSPKSSAVSFLQSTPGGSAPSAEGTGGITEITNQMADLDIRDAGSFDENMESFLSHDGGDGNIYGILKHEAESSKGFSEFGCIQTINKVTSCHFSSDGKLLASAGHDKRAVFWNVDTLQSVTTPEEHRYLITDIRFRPNSTQVATASFDKSVRLWDAANPGYCLNAYTGHAHHVVSLDFHPKKNDLFCFPIATMKFNIGISTHSHALEFLSKEAVLM